MENNERIAVIDGNSLVFRAFYAMSNPMITSRGVFTQAIFGFLNMLSKAVEDAKPDYIAIAFDRKAPTFRHLEYAEYKAGRAKTPDELVMQFPYIKDILAAMRIPVLEMDGFEADDLIGTVCKKAEAAGLSVLVITGDRDELQLASDKTSVMITKKGVSEFELNTPESMREKYGFGPELFVDYKGLMGDSSDNIPGLPGVGEKTAAKLILQFGSVEDILEHVGEVKPDRIRGIIEDNSQLAVMSKRLATIVTDAPIDIDFEAMRVQPWDIARLTELYTELEFRVFLKKLKSVAKAQGISDEEFEGMHASGGADFAAGAGYASRPKTDFSKIRIVDPESFETSIIDNALSLVNLKDKLLGADEAVIRLLGSNDHVHLPFVYAILLLVNHTLYFIETFRNPSLLKSTAEMLRDVQAAAGSAAADSSAKAVAGARQTGSGDSQSGGGGSGDGSNGQGDGGNGQGDGSGSEGRPGGLCLKGCDLQEDLFQLKRTLGEDVCFPPVSFDIQVAHYLLAPNAGNAALPQIALTHAGLRVPEEPNLAEGLLAILPGDIAAYGRAYCAAVRTLEPVLRASLEEEGLTKLFDEVEVPLVTTLAGTEVNGFTFDAAALTEIDQAIVARVEELTAQITELAGEAFNLNSPRQLGEILFEKIGLPGGKKNKNGYSTNADILEKLRGAHPIIGPVLEYRMLVKLKGTYIDGLPTFVCPDGKIRAHLQQTVTATGRLSCTDPNLQNIPIRQEPGRFLRKAFVPESDAFILMGADYSQIELRILAHLSQDPFLTDDFLSGADIHRRTAARVFGVENEADVTQAQRSGAKAVNFGIIYGMSTFGLSEELAISRKDAGRYITEYFAKHAAVKAYLDKSIAEARENGFSTTIMGRRRAIPEIHASQYMTRQLGERLAMNSPVQGSAADIIKVAMNRVYNRLLAEGLRSKVILQVHDELILQVPRGEEEQAARVLKEEMENAVELRVPLLVEIHTGADWHALK
jgi:DNA polymerase-1